MCEPNHQDPHPYHGIRGTLAGIRVAVVNIWRADCPWWRLPAEVASNLRLRMGNGWLCCGNPGQPAC